MTHCRKAFSTTFHESALHIQKESWAHSFTEVKTDMDLISFNEHKEMHPHLQNKFYTNSNACIK